MSYRQGGYMTVWDVKPGKFGDTTRVRLSSSRKDKQTGEYIQDFAGFCTFFGKAGDDAMSLKPRDRIKLGECDVTTKFDKAKNVEYVNYRVFGFEMADGGNSMANMTPEEKKAAVRAAAQKRTALEEDIGYGEGELPY